jgi:hypothetical protein
MKLKSLTKKFIKLNGLALLGLTSLAGQAIAQDSAALSGDKERLSYALGMDLGQQLHKLAVDVEPSLFAKGLGDALTGNKTLMTREEANAAIAALQEELKNRAEEKAMLRAPQTEQQGESQAVPSKPN